MTPALNSVVHSDAIALCRELPEASVDLIATDPPYGVTSCHWDKKVPLDAMWDAFKRIIKPRGAIVITASQPFTSELVMSNREMFRYEWIWLKDNGSDFLNVNRKPFEAHESVLIFYAQQPVYNPQMQIGAPYRLLRGTAHRSGLRQPDVANGTQTINLGFRYPKSYQFFTTERGLHPSQKSTALFEYLIKTYTRPGDLVVDPFCGSGTTAIAARNTGRNYIVVDFLQEYVDITNRRLALPFTPPLFDLDAPAAPRAETLPLWTEAD